jgi:hypothetical protein
VSYFRPGTRLGYCHRGGLAGLHEKSAGGTDILVPELNLYVTPKPSAATAAGQQLSPPDIDAAQYQTLMARGSGVSPIGAALTAYYRHYQASGGTQPKEKGLMEKIMGALKPGGKGGGADAQEAGQTTGDQGQPDQGGSSGSGASGTADKKKKAGGAPGVGTMLAIGGAGLVGILLLTTQFGKKNPRRKNSYSPRRNRARRSR